MYLGLEIGGTKLQVGLGPGDGTLAGLWRGAVEAAAGPEAIRRQIRAAIPDLLARAGLDRSQVRGVGIGFGGPVNDATHTVIKSHQIEGWEDFPLAAWVTQSTGWPAVLGNDADMAGLAEALLGAGQGVSPVFYITIGSGIGGGFIINGEIYRGCGRGAAEIGHLRVGVDEGGLGRVGLTLEAVASGWAIGQHARNRASQRFNPESPLYRLVDGQWQRLTAAHVGQAASQGDELALQVLKETIGYLAEAICQVVPLLCPRRIIIGGGVSLMGEEVLFQPLREQVARSVFRPFARCFEILPAALGEEVVVHGALAQARQRLKGHPR
jgi:glucokinase